jgi:hypothetical protein
MCGEHKPRVNFDLPGFMKVVQSKGADRAFWTAFHDLLMLTWKGLTGQGRGSK